MLTTGQGATSPRTLVATGLTSGTPREFTRSCGVDEVLEFTLDCGVLDRKLPLREGSAPLELTLDCEGVVDRMLLLDDGSTFSGVEHDRAAACLIGNGDSVITTSGDERDAGCCGAAVQRTWATVARRANSEAGVAGIEAGSSSSIASSSYAAEPYVSRVSESSSP